MGIELGGGSTDTTPYLQLGTIALRNGVVNRNCVCPDSEKGRKTRTIRSEACGTRHRRSSAIPAIVFLLGSCLQNETYPGT